MIRWAVSTRPVAIPTGRGATRVVASCRRPPMPGSARECGSTRPGSLARSPSWRRLRVAADASVLTWEQTVGVGETAYFQDHRIQDIPSLSTSAMVEMVVTAASRTLGTEALELVDLELRRAFLLPREGAYRLQTVLTRGS